MNGLELQVEWKYENIPMMVGEWHKKKSEKWIEQLDVVQEVTKFRAGQKKLTFIRFDFWANARALYGLRACNFQTRSASEKRVYAIHKYITRIISLCIYFPLENVYDVLCKGEKKTREKTFADIGPLHIPQQEVRSFKGPSTHTYMFLWNSNQQETAVE